MKKNVEAIRRISSAHKKTIALLLLACIAPTILNFFGFDFGSQRLDYDPQFSLSLQPENRIDYIHSVLQGDFTHTLLEWTTFCITIITIMLAYTIFKVNKNIAVIAIGFALFFAGIIDSFHTLLATGLLRDMVDNQNLIPFTWFISRIFYVLLVYAVMTILITQIRRKFEIIKAVFIFSATFFVIIMYVLNSYGTENTLVLNTIYPSSIIKRPFDIIPLVLFIVAGFTIYPSFFRYQSGVFSFTLLLSLIPNIVSQSHMAFGSSALFDNHFNIAHFNKIFAYLLPFSGLLIEYVSTFRQERKISEELQKAIEEKAQITHELKENKARMDLALQAGGIGTWELDITNNKISYDNYMGPIFGLKAGTFPDNFQEFLTLLHPDDRESAANAVKNSVEKHIDYDTNYRVFWPDQSEHVIEAKGKVFKDDEGNPKIIRGICMDVTAEITAENQLKESKERMNLALKAADVGTWQLDIVTGEMSADDYLGPIFGLMPGQFPSDFPDFLNLIHPDDRDSTDRAVRRSVELDIEYETHFKVPLNGEGCHTIAAKGKVFKDQEGFPSKIFGICWDVTEEKIAEKALRESESRFRLMADTAPVMIWICNHNKHYTYFNKVWLEFREKSIEEEIRNGWTKDIHPDDIDNYKYIFNEVFKSKSEFILEFRLKRFDNEYRWILFHGTPKIDSSSEMGGYIGTAIDITERKKVEEVLVRNEERLNLALESSGIGTWVWDLKEDTLIWDAYMYPLYGLGYGEFSEKHEDFLKLIYEEDRKRIEKEVASAISIEDADEYDTEYRIILKDGSRRILTSKGRVHRDERQNAIWMTGVSWDITESKEAEGKQIQLLKEVEDINQELKDFAYIVSHDLKAPLRAISSLADWISTDYADKFDDDGKEQMELLKGRVQRMHNLIGGILEYSRVGRQQEVTEPIDLNKFLPEIIDFIAPSRNITVTVQENMPEIMYDKTRIQQVFQNLLSNAIKYNDKPHGKINISWVQENGFWKFGVSDNGPGIDAKYHEKIFQIFQTLKARDEYESTGVGLSVVQKIIKGYGGSIWVESEVGKGSTFYFNLPDKSKSALLQEQ